MKVFFDTEFTGLQKDTSLISLGMVSEDGHTFYAEFTDYHRHQINDWHKDNVLTHLSLRHYTPHFSHISVPEKWVRAKGPRNYIGNCITNYFRLIGQPVELWADCCAYDWVLFCDIFGSALHIPSEFITNPYMPCDLDTVLRTIQPDIAGISRSDWLANELGELPKQLNESLKAELLDHNGHLLPHHALGDAFQAYLGYSKLFPPS